MIQDIHKDFKEFLQLLIDRQIVFLVIGGYAVSWHGEPRNTEDIDIWVERSPTNAAKLVSALKDFGFDQPNLSADLFLRESGIVQMGVEPWRIDLFTSIPGVEFAPCYERREIWPISDLQVPIISLSDLRINKIASGRPKDFADLAHHLPES